MALLFNSKTEQQELSESERRIAEALERYCQKGKDSHHAVALNGVWGCGKTYFVEHGLSDYFSSIDLHRHVIRVSLFGVSSLDDFYNRIVQAVLYYEATIDTRPTESVARNVNKAFREAMLKQLSAFLKGIKKRAGIAYEIPPQLMAALACDSAKLLVFDDIERIGNINPTELFGAIEDLVESQHRKVLLVMNEEKIRQKMEEGQPDQRSNDVLYEIFEKLVWDRFEYEPDFNRVTKALIGNSFDEFPDEIDAENTFINAAKEHGAYNLRSFEKCTVAMERIAKCGFFQIEDIDLERKQQVLKDAFLFLLAEVDGTIDKLLSSRPSTMPAALVNDKDGPDIDQDADEWYELKKMQSFLPIRQYMNMASENNSDAIRHCLTSFASAFYPETTEAKNAIDAARQLMTNRLLEDDDMRELALTLRIGFDSGSLSVWNISNCLLAYFSLMTMGFISEEDYEKAAATFKSIVESDPMSAFEALAVGAIVLPTTPSELNQIETGSAPPDYATMIKDTFINSFDSCITNAVDSNSEDAAAELADFMKHCFDINPISITYVTSNWFVECVKHSNVKSLHELEKYFKALPHQLGAFGIELEPVQKWLHEIFDALASLSVSSTTRTRMIDRLKNEINSAEKVVEGRPNTVAAN